jgi:type IV pilus assembly protein PilV
MGHPHHQSGFTLIEVLVSVVILSIGLLGLVALQTTSYRYEHDAFLHSVATNQAYAMIDSMHSNSAGIAAGAYNAINYANSVNATPCTNCSPTQMAVLDGYLWNTMLRQMLPSGQGSVSYNSATGLYVVSVMWDARRTGATGTGCSGNAAVDLTCIQVTTRL